MKRLVGRETVDYVSKKTNNPVKGVSLHVVGGTSNRIEGEAVETIFISEKNDLYAAVMKAPLGSELKVSYNRFGSVEDMEIIPAK